MNKSMRVWMYALGLAASSWAAPLLAEGAAVNTAPVDTTLTRGAMLGNTCMACHGPGGESAGEGIPSINDLGAERLESLMLEYKRDERMSTLMGRIAKGYSDADIALIADYFAN